MHDRQSNPIVRFGCYGWDHPQWQASYFPVDLPTDWRLAYFANDTSCVMVPASLFSALSDVELDALAIAELPDEFHFYLDARAAEAPPSVFVEILGDRLAALVGSQSTAPLAATQVLLPVDVADGRAWACEGHALLLLEDIGPDLRAWRRRFDDLRTWMLDYHEVALIVQGARITPLALNDLKTVAELMGFS